MSRYRRKDNHHGSRPRWSDEDGTLMERLTDWAEGLLEDPKRAFRAVRVMLLGVVILVAGLWLSGHINARPGEPTLGDELRSFVGGLRKTVNQADQCEEVSTRARKTIGELERRQEEFVSRMRSLYRRGDERLGTERMADSPEGRLWARIRRYQGLDPESLRAIEGRLSPEKHETPGAIRLRTVRAENIERFANLKMREIAYLNHRLKRLEATALKAP